MNACAVTQDLDRHLAAVVADNARDELVEAKLAELMRDPKIVADAFDRLLDNRTYRRDVRTGKATNTPLAEYLAEHVIDGSRFAAAFLMDHLSELARIELDSAAEAAVDAERNASAVEAATARLAHDEMAGAA